MKKILFIFFVLLSLSLNVYAIGPKHYQEMMTLYNAAAASGPSNDADEGFEGGYELSWTETDTSNFINDSDTTRPKTGSNNALVAWTSSTQATAYYDFGAAKDNVEIDIWFSVEAYGASWTFYSFLHLGANSAWNDGVTDVLLKQRTTNQSDHLIGGYYDGTTEETVTGLSPDTLYKIVIDYNRNAASTIKIYNAAEAQQGSDITFTATDEGVRYLHFGSRSGANGMSFAYDDIGIRYQ